MVRLGGMVLCGGKSSRMGLPKASLPFGSESMLVRVVRLLSQAADPIAVVGAPQQALPDLPGAVLWTRDRREGQGPLEGLRAGLTALEPHVDTAFVVGCDVPLLAPALVLRMAERLEQHDVAVAVDGEFHHPLAAVYRVSVLPHIVELLAENRLRPVFLYDRVSTRRVPIDELRDVDARLQSFINLNRPEDYFAALRQADLTPDAETLRRLA
ncbi:MAG: molybdenum cofactor guanylyltransferase [Pirellulaceae bacterium]